MHEYTEIKMSSTLSQGVTIILEAEVDGVTEYKIYVGEGESMPLSMQDVEDMVQLWSEFHRVIHEGSSSG